MLIAAADHTLSKPVGVALTLAILTWLLTLASYLRGAHNVADGGQRWSAEIIALVAAPFAVLLVSTCVAVTLRRARGRRAALAAGAAALFFLSAGALGFLVLLAATPL